jgi:hypothetical protein
MVQREARCLNPFCAIRFLITTFNSVIVSLVEDSAINLIRFASFVSSGTHVWETFGKTIGETIGEMMEETIGEMIGAMIGEMIGEMIRIVSTDATNAVSVN